MQALNKIFEFFILKLTKKILAVEIIEIRDQQGGQFFYNALVLINENNKVQIEKKIVQADHTAFQKWVSEDVPPGTPIVLIVNSDKILHRIIATNDTDNYSNAVTELIPNSDPKDFFIQSYPLNDSTIFFSVTRKNYIDTIYEMSDSFKKDVIRLSIGPFPIFSMHKALFKHDEKEIYRIIFDNYSFVLHEDKLLDYAISPYRLSNDLDQISVAGENLDTPLLIPFSYGINYLLHPLSSSNLEYSTVKNNENNFIFNKIGKLITVSCVSILFITLLVSTVVFAVYQNKYQALSTHFNLIQKRSEQILAEKELYRKKKDILDRSGISIKSAIAYYSDQITSSLPDDIFLKKMNIHPLNTKNIDDNFQFINNKIIIEGNCYSSNDLNNWISLLKKNNWISSIIITDYKQNHQELLGSFSIEITQI
ncbi:MAG: PilN domain-containing protein [Flavipsychrobacter sp.]|nr:PilN domain-containing protein [Flavipsychrobacter sp.]